MTAVPAAPKGRAGGLLGSPVVAVVAWAMALVMITLAAVIYLIGRPADRTPPVPVVLGERAPSAFTIDLQAATSPMVTRGQAVSVVLTAPADIELDRIEVWQDSQLVYRLDDPAAVAGPATDQVRFAVDLVPMTAGGHLALARAYDTEGNLAQTAPLAIPALDLAEDLGEFVAKDADGNGIWPGLRLSSAPGESLASIGDRLGVDPSDLVSADGTTMLNAPLPLGTVVTGVIPPVDRLKLPPQLTDDELSYLDVVLDGCDVVVTSERNADLRVYGGAGLVALGDLPAGGELRLATLPVGPTMLVGYPAGTADPEAEPSFPVTVTIPDECARDGWTGEAYLTGGLMLTDFAIPQPYAYIAVDKGDWQRVPTQEGSFLNGSSTALTDLRPYLDLTAYDQIDLEVWSGSRGEGPVASGHFCRAQATHLGSQGGSGSQGECAPVGAVVPGAPGGAASLTLTIDASAAGSSTSAAAFTKGVWLSTPPPGIAFTAQQREPVEVRFTTDAVEVGATGDVYYQFSYLPLTAGSSGMNLPGVFHTERAAADGSLVIDPWAWHAAKVTPESLDEVDKLSLTDEVAWGTAHQRLLEGRSLIDTVYVRAVTATMPPTGSLVPAGAASASGVIEMPSLFDGDHPTITDPQLNLTPGWVLESDYAPATDRFSNQATRSTTTCHQVVRYPEPNTYATYPGSWSYRGPDGKVYGSVPLDADPDKYPRIPDSGLSDRTVAKQAWPRADVVYCLDWDAAQKREQSAIQAAREAQECGVGCILSMIAYGALQGFLIGGPYGALVGAFSGLALGVASALDPEFYTLVRLAWDAIAGIYNAVFVAVWQVVDAINPLCNTLGAASAKAKAICDSGFHAVGSAVYTYYTGMPPTLPDSTQALAAAEGDLSALIQFALDELLGNLGLSCASFTLDASSLAILDEAASSQGLDSSELAIAKNSGGDISGCAAIANVIAKAAVAMDARRQEQLMATMTGEPAVPGLLLAPVGNSQPVLRITAPRTDPETMTRSLSCPFVANVEITEAGQTRRLLPLEGVLRAKVPRRSMSGTLTAQPWVADLVIPASHAPFAQTNGATWWTEPASANVREVVPAATGAPYLHIAVDSPCFESTRVLDAPQYGTDASAQAGYILDDRPIRTYR